MNLLSETIEDIKDSGHKISEIIFIGSEHSGHSCTWNEFTALANHDYDNGFGAQKVADDLIIVFKDTAKMWRHEYDGSECWNYSKPFKVPEDKKKITALFVSGTGWESLTDINKATTQE